MFLHKFCLYHVKVKKVKEVDLYSAFIVVPHTQGAQVQCYLQFTPYLPLPHKHSPDGGIPRLRLWTSNCSLLLIYLPRKDERLSRHYNSQVVDISDMSLSCQCLYAAYAQTSSVCLSWLLS